MPRSGTTGVYSLPPNTDNQQPLTPILSSMFNNFADDVEQAFNTPTPIAFGGTNAATESAARTNLGVNFYDGAMTLTPAEQGQMRANFSGDLLAGFRNKIINGDFDVWQRGGSASGVTTANSYGPDCWLISTSGATVSWSRQNQVIGLTTIPGNPQYFCRLSATSADDNVAFSNTIPGVRTLAGQLVTITAYLKSPTTAPSGLAVRLVQNFGTTGDAPVTTTVASGVTVTSSFVKYQWTVTVPSISGKNIDSDNSDYLRLTFINTANQTFTLDFAHISLVEGNASAERDPFAARSISQEIELCRYFFRKSYFLAQSPGFVTTSGMSIVKYFGGSGVLGSPLFSRTTVDMGTAMRVVPTVVIYSPATGASGSLYDQTSDVGANATNVSNTSFLAGWVTSPGTSNFVGSFHWTADASFY